MRTKIIIAAILLVLVGGIVFAISLSNQNDSTNNPTATATPMAPVTENPAETPEPGEGRPTSLPGWEEGIIIAEPLPVGEGTVGEEVQGKRLPDYYYNDILLPFDGEATFQQGAGLLLTASELPADTEFVATIKPRENADFEPIEVGSVTSDEEGMLDQEKLDLPTNLGLGLYDMTISGGDKTFNIVFYVEKPQQ